MNRILISLICFTFFGCMTKNKTISKEKSCKLCNELFHENFFVEYPIGKFEIGKWKRDGFVLESRDIPSVKKRVDENGNLRIVDEKKVRLLNKYKFCFIGNNLKTIDSFFDKNIKREKVKLNTKEIKLSLCFDFGNLKNDLASWFDYECLSFKLRKDKNDYVYLGSELEKKNYENCGENVNSLQDKFNEKMKKRDN